MASQAAARTFRFLTASQIQCLHTTVVVRGAQPSQVALLESAANSPPNVNYYTPTENVFQLAAVLSEKLIKNHAFQDGNKRTALVAADVFLKINGCRLQERSERPMAQENSNRDLDRDLADALNTVCTNQWTSEQLAGYYKAIAAPISGWIK